MAKIVEFPGNTKRDNTNGNTALKVREQTVKRASEPVIYREKLMRFLESLNGKIVSIDFHKLSGEFRTVNGRMGVRKYTKGVKQSVNDRTDLPYVCIYEMPTPRTYTKGGYRNVDISSIIVIRANKQLYFIL